jgi:hypothetical protein
MMKLLLRFIAVLFLGFVLGRVMVTPNTAPTDSAAPIETDRLEQIEPAPKENDNV